MCARLEAEVDEAELEKQRKRQAYLKGLLTPIKTGKEQLLQSVENELQKVMEEKQRRERRQKYSRLKAEQNTDRVLDLEESRLKTLREFLQNISSEGEKQKERYDQLLSTLEENEQLRKEVYEKSLVNIEEERRFRRKLLGNIERARENEEEIRKYWKRKGVILR